MIMNGAFGDLIREPEFYKRFRYFAVDEAHITVEWKEFRDAFANVARLQNRFPCRIPWLALSATVEPRVEFTSLANSLGFRLEDTEVLRLPVDRPSIAYSPRFLQYACSENSTEFLDLSFAVPKQVERIEDIPTTVIFAGRVKEVTSIAEYLTRLLPQTLDRKARARAILPMDGTMSAGYNVRAVERLGQGDQTRILVCTATGALGIDISQVRRSIVLVDKGTTYRMICQKAGRIRTEGQCVYLFPKWMDYSQKNARDEKNRADVEPVVLKFANATVEQCPRVVNAEYWGDQGVPSSAVGRPCCNRHNPEIDRADLELVKERGTAARKKKKEGQAAPLRSDRTHRPPDETVMQPIARAMIVQWRHIHARESVEYETHHPPSAILPCRDLPREDPYFSQFTDLNQ
ncbi:hypothetical protein FS749_003669, partial [Ceratobasidium sp. UAMH 11750]